VSESPSPVVTIGLPIYNGATYLGAALRALLAQDYPSFEIVISDNCSTDSSPEICREFMARDDRIRYFRNERNLGAAANYNRVVELARGKYFAWANHDDLWGTSFIARCVAELERRPDAVLAYARSAKIDDDGNQVAPMMGELGLEGDTPSERLRRFHDWFIVLDEEDGWSTDKVEGIWMPVHGLIRTERLRETGMIGLYIASDTILLEELLMRGAFAEVEETLFFKRDHEERSMRASVSYDDRVDWFTGHKAGLLIFPRWRLLAERVKAVRNVHLPDSAARACYREMIGFYFRRPHEGKALVKEILVNGVRVAQPVLRKLRLADRAAPEKW
jgi:glycosyltransferase involved in cell wall biosynthesis